MNVRVLIVLVMLYCGSGCQQVGSRLSPVAQARVSGQQKADVQLAIGKSAEKQGDMEAAIRAYQTATANDSLRSEPYQRLGVLFFKKGNTELSERMFQEALTRTPRSADLHCDFGYCLYLQKRFEESEQHLRQAVAISPSHARANNNLGMLLGSKKQYDEALDAFARGGLSESDARANLSFAMMMQSDMGEAREQLNVAGTVDRRGAAGERIGRLSKALQKVEQEKVQVLAATDLDRGPITQDEKVFVGSSKRELHRARLHAKAISDETPTLADSITKPTADQFAKVVTLVSDEVLSEKKPEPIRDTSHVTNSWSPVRPPIELVSADATKTVVRKQVVEEPVQHATGNANTKRSIVQRLPNAVDKDSKVEFASHTNSEVKEPDVDSATFMRQLMQAK